MKDDTISRTAAIEAINQICPIDTEYDCTLLDKVDVRCVLTDLPSTQPEPSTAYWKKDVFGTVICSKCGGIRRDNRVDHIQWCNSCGCYMRGEQDDEQRSN